MENVNNRIQKAFQNHKAFIPFITVGDPDIDTTKDVVRAAVAAGADLIELGIPFSDPTAEGPVIMEADIRALKAGTTTEKVFQLTKELRQEFPEVALVYMTYANVVYHYGIQRFSERASDAGIDGLILPDVPLEERGEFDGILSQYGIVGVILFCIFWKRRLTAFNRIEDMRYYRIAMITFFCLAIEQTADTSWLSGKGMGYCMLIGLCLNANRNSLPLTVDGLENDDEDDDLENIGQTEPRTKLPMG